MIPNGEEMNWNGHHLVFESENDPCRGCFFADKDECPECDEGLWVEKNSSPWHTGLPTKEGKYLVKYAYQLQNPSKYKIDYSVECFYIDSVYVGGTGFTGDWTTARILGWKEIEDED